MLHTYTEGWQKLLEILPLLGIIGASCNSLELQVLGNRSMKLKYLNPNVLFAASGLQEASPKAFLGEAALTVQLIDTISGQIIYQQSLEVHPNIDHHSLQRLWHHMQNQPIMPCKTET